MKKFKLRVDRVPVVEEQWQAHAHIALNWHGRLPDGETILSAECRTTGEVRCWADELIRELQQIKKKAENVKWDNHPSRKARK